ncbi:hypothetical protein HMPREF1551_00864 [Capnocytophaga sp. oral taxon 863 str. F0517]|uniref:HmuY family protein n=1 Tax=Capnocytophaga sp. oral taxon 863 TaxID=1227265 RepID=UPI00039613ED|nr:HmuY family protein [Capnocytophaga sp. oral taxon 863]ERI63927.1 hypothetical protein HMPREF1551_00864 [Capnocytophaga sp. oral taxon 863 str. F0517]
MKLKFLAPALLAGLVAFTSCSKDDSKKEEPKKENNQGGGNQQGGNQQGGNQQGEQKPATDKITLDFSGTEAKEQQLSALTGWTYFSLKNGVVTPENPAEDLSWDIAFKQYFVKLNGGTSGKGKAEAFKTEEKDFAKVTEAPKTGFVKDKEEKFTDREGKEVSRDNVSPLLTGGFFSKTGMIEINPANIKKYGDKNVFGTNEWVYIIKTADGTYAKIQLTDIYKEILGKKVPFFLNLKYQLSKTVSE